MIDPSSPVSPADHHEETVWAGSVSQWHYAGKWFAIVLLLAICIASFPFSMGRDPTTLWIIRGVLVLLAVVLVVWIRLDRSGRKYIVTNKRVSVEFGIISKQSTELRIQDIRSINLTTSGVSGLVGIGRLEFSSAASDDADVIFWNVPDAEKIRDTVRSLQAAIS
jgi:membrane protein YdbS with pleckstrin-like domain